MKRLIIISLFMLAPLAYADYHYAGHEGTNQEPYDSWETAADSIQNAVDASSPHDTVYIGAGEWYESVATEYYDSIAIIGMGIDSTFLYTDEYRVEVLTIDYNCSVEGITIEHLDGWIALFARPYASVSIKSCKFINSAIAVQFSGGESEVKNCIIEGCNKPIDCFFGDYYIHISNNLILGAGTSSISDVVEIWADSALIENNIIINDIASQQRTILTDNLTNKKLFCNNIIIYGVDGIIATATERSNNVIKDLKHFFDALAMQPGEGELIVNNSISNCYRPVRLYGSCTISYNNFWNNAFDIIDYGHEFDSIGNIFCEPMFISNTDVHLQAFSPLIDAGDPNVLDVDGSRSDIGAYGGPGGCSYTYLDLAPQIPDSIIVEIDSNIVSLVWPYNTEADFNRYQIFRDTVAGFEPTIFDIIAEPETSFYEDTDINPETAYYYKLTSVDNQGNVSDYSDEVAVIPTYIPGFLDNGLPKYTTIDCAYPNPSNSNVTIVYSASQLGPQPPEIKLVVYDIQGRVVRTLVDDRIPMGTYRAVWDGTNDNGESVASGTYIAKVSQWGMDAGDFPVKITLLK